MRILNLEGKSLADRFGIGLAGLDFQMLKPVGNGLSIGLRGDGKIHFEVDSNSINLRQNQDTNLFRQKGTTVGVGYVFMTQRVFFTINGREVYQCTLP